MKKAIIFGIVVVCISCSDDHPMLSNTALHPPLPADTIQNVVGNRLANSVSEGFYDSFTHQKFQTSRKAIDLIPELHTSLGDREDSFAMANAGEPWECCCTRTGQLPHHQLLLLGSSKDFYFLSYQSGGFATTGHLIIWQKQADTLFTPKVHLSGISANTLRAIKTALKARVQ